MCKCVYRQVCPPMSGCAFCISAGVIVSGLASPSAHIPVWDLRTCPRVRLHGLGPCRGPAWLRLWCVRSVAAPVSTAAGPPLLLCLHPPPCHPGVFHSLEAAPRTAVGCGCETLLAGRPGWASGRAEVPGSADPAHRGSQAPALLEVGFGGRGPRGQAKRGREG